MEWRFTILNRAGVTTEIDEPVGWDACEIKIDRDKDTHGIFFDYQGNDFQFNGKGAELLKDEYDQYGIEGNMILIIEQSCNGVFEELYRGRFLFGKYVFVCGGECYVKIPIETSSDIMELRNKWDQPVNLEATVAFDEQTQLEKYDHLGRIVTLPSKSIAVKNEAKGLDSAGYNMRHPNSNYNQFSIFINGEPISEIGNFGFPGSVEWTHLNSSNNPVQVWNAPNTEPVGTTFPHMKGKPEYVITINYVPSTANYGFVSSPIRVRYKISGSIIVDRSYVGLSGVLFVRQKPNTSGENGDDYDLLKAHKVTEFQGDAQDTVDRGVQPGVTVKFSVEFNELVNIENGNKFMIFYTAYHTYYKEQADEVQGNENLYFYRIQYNADNYFIAEAETQGAPTPCKMFFPNEAFSRVAEAITDGKIKALSEYYGRTESMPYNHDSDGCGSLQPITKGLFIRRKEQQLEGRPPILSVSLKDLFAGYEPIHHIGCGIEDNPRGEGNVLRIEHWKYFYSLDTVMRCEFVNTIQREIDEKKHYSVFSFGYEKWEAEEYTGLDEFLTKRKYRTTLNTVSNELSKLSKFVASGYAIEITRRVGNEDSKDWRYDNDVFIICCKREVDEAIEVEAGGILNPENIIDPETIYNYRISPIRNAMRWMDMINEGYRSTGKIIFTDGDGNYYAKGWMQGDCSPENKPIAENDSIDESTFKNLSYLAIRHAESIQFEYPLSMREFTDIKNNPYGLIYFNSDCEEGYGWIDELTYRPADGMANFKLIPRKI